MNLATALRLGRVSNLPTVGTNAIAGMTLAGGMLAPFGIVLLVLAAGLAYVAGMFLNDAFDAEMDAVHQPFRPIPSGLVRRRTVFAWGFAMLAVAVALFALAGLLGGGGLWPALAGLVLAGFILAYNRDHKENAFGPLLMGLCRVLVYVAAALTVAPNLPPWVWIGSALLLSHVMGLTYLAKMADRGGFAGIWPIICLLVPVVAGLALAPVQLMVLPFALALGVSNLFAIRLCRGQGKGGPGRAIPLLIASICFLDAMLAASQGMGLLACLAALGMPLTLWLQRWVRGT